MDDPTKNPTVQNPVVPVVQDNNQSPVQPSVQPVGTANKEVQRPVSDYVVTSESLPTIENELKDIGVEAQSEAVELTQEHEKIGVTHSLENNVPNIEQAGSEKLPITKDLAEKAVKQNKGKISFSISEQMDGIYILPSIFGIATLIIKNLKKVHGKIMGKN